MILGRIGTLTFTRYRRQYRQTKLLYSSTSVAVVIGVTVGYKLCDGKTPIHALDDSIALLIPTIEASIRAMRLFRTSFLMAMDYEGAKAKRMLFRQGSSAKEELEMERLELNVELREKELEEAQIEYAGEDSPKTENMSPNERKDLKLNQKRRMQEAAVRLAEAEKQLVEMEGESEKSKLHRKAAQRLLKLCQENGGVYIKVGQHLANLDYLIPQEYIEVLSSLFDAAPQSDFKDVCRVIEEELNGRVDAIFDRFDSVPIASASLAQVHIAYDKKTGKKLAVKVQHAGLRETSAGDIFAVTCVVRFVDSLFEDFTFGWIADEMAPHLPKELDFLNEGKNAERAARHLETTGLQVVVPKIIWKKTAPRVLTMEFEEGFKATDLRSIEAAGLNKFSVAKLISSVFNSQVFLSGWVHCDPHPANVLLRSKNGRPEMVLVDHGLYKELDDDFRFQYGQLWRSLMMADLNGIEMACNGMGIGKVYPLFAAMLTARPFDEIIERSKTGSFSAPFAAPESQADRAVIRGYAKQFLKDIFVLMGILPRQMLLLLKMNDCLRHIDLALGSPTNTLAVAEYMQVLFRIQVYDISEWALRAVSRRKLSLT